LFYSAVSLACYSNSCKQDCAAMESCTNYIAFCACGGSMLAASEQESLNAYYNTDVEIIHSDDNQHDFVIDSKGNILDQIK